MLSLAPSYFLCLFTYQVPLKIILLPLRIGPLKNSPPTWICQKNVPLFMNKQVGVLGKWAYILAIFRLYYLLCLLTPTQTMCRVNSSLLHEICSKLQPLKFATFSKEVIFMWNKPGVDIKWKPWNCLYMKGTDVFLLAESFKHLSNLLHDEIFD